MNESELDLLVKRVQDGDKDAFGEVVFAIRKEVRIFLSAHASSIDMIDEVLQSALVACYENIGKYERRGTFLSWVKGIARNLLLKEVRARARYVAPDEDALDRIVVESAVHSLQAQDREEASVERLRACMEKLPEPSRRLVQQRYFHGFSVKEIARLGNKTETAIAVTLFRIRDLLRDCMTREVTP